ncbi:hypothetical protein M0208_14750 [Sphingomonas sp. SUN019]|uniref:hypothetical protein n=1 Tax=Sphingomonas sp. SUN019 TaxID=2937788 RepID=UPI002164CFCB|nr:hypothetical protein [Sphingomonas sp. SUN019]UVO51704.1 hypothetical protein M0208_14750 [Sphingomonas sp. SUN019]
MIVSNPPGTRPGGGDAPAVRPWPIRKVGRFFQDYAFQVLVGVSTTMLGGALTSYIWQVKEGNLPSPREIISSVRSDGLNAPQRPEGIVGIELQSDNSPASRLVAPMHLRIVERVRSVAAPLTGTRIVYRLGDLHSTGTARSAVDLRWAMRTPSRGWRLCGPVGLRFANHSALVEAIAARLNNAIAATEKSGESSCS